jgi:FixJ family two-component response regulator
MSPTPRRVHLIDDDADVRQALEMLLTSAGFTVTTYSDARAFLERRQQGAQGCIVTDMRMPGLSGLQLLERLGTEGSGMPVVVITGHGDVAACRRALKGGAVDFLTKPVEEHVLLEVLEAGFARLEETVAASLEASEARALLAKLTAREREVLDMVTQGWATKEIARALDVSPRTIETHRANLAEKLGTASVAEMVRIVLSGA